MEENKILNEDMFTNLVSSFGPLKDEDNDKIEKIIKSIDKYDKSQFLQRISALRLHFKNRDKAVLIDAVTTETLRWLYKNNWNFDGIPMSYGKFKKIIGSINQLGSKTAIDPLDNPYIDDIQFYGNYKVLPGINQGSSYNLKILIKTIFRSGKNRLSEEKSQVIVDIVSFYLNISTYISNELYFIDELTFEREIFIPDKYTLDKYIDLIKYEQKNSYFNSLLIDKLEFALEKNKPFSQTDHSFLIKPFIETDNEIILLDATSIANALCNFLNNEISPQNVFEEVWKDIRYSLKRLGHFKVEERNLNLTLIEENNYKESILTVANDKFLLVYGLFSGINESVDLSERLSNRISNIVSNLYEIGVKQEEIFVLVVRHTFGGQIAPSVRSMKFPTLQLNAMEIKAISSVEKDTLFLPRLMAAKINRVFPNMYGDFWSAVFFSKNDMSFYANDDIDYREMQTSIAIEETSDYYLEALKKNSEKMFRSLHDDNWYTGIKEDFDNRYLVDMSKGNELKCFIESKNRKLIEVVTEKINQPEKLGVLLNCLDTISYWLEKYYSNQVIPDNILIYLHLEDVDIQKYFLEKNVAEKSKNIKIDREKNQLYVEVPANFYKNMGMSQTNHYEKSMLVSIVNIISESVDESYIETIFRPVFKKKMTGVVIDDSGKLKIPTQGFKLLTVSEYEINKLLDELGMYLKDKEYEYGPISKDSNANFCNDIVGYLYSILESEVKIFDKNQLINILVSQIETLLPLQLRDESSYNNDISLSPLEKEYFFEKLNENNRCSLATKFLLEYVVATPNSGTSNAGIWELERLLAVCSLIIEWAHRSDYFKYNLVDTTINFLPSNRIGLIKKDFESINKAMLSSRNDYLAVKSTNQIKDTSYRKKIELLLNDRLNDSFQDSFEFTYEEYDAVINLLVDIFDDLNRIIWIIKKEIAIDKIFQESKGNLPRGTIVLVLNFITSEERLAYLKPPKGYKGIDIFPWIFNRPLSFIRRPIIEHQEKFIFGIRNILHSRKYLLKLIWQGKLKTKGKLMKDLMSRLRNIEGDIFNEHVKQRLESYEELEVTKGVSKIGNKHIADDNNKTLGDIDIFAINRKRKKIYLIETKDFSFSRNPYEIAMEREKMFSGDKSFLNKHLRRHFWVEKNLDYILEYYELEQDIWKVIPMFVVSEYLITKDLINNYDVKFYSESQLSVEVFK